MSNKTTLPARGSEALASILATGDFTDLLCTSKLMRGHSLLTTAIRESLDNAHADESGVAIASADEAVCLALETLSRIVAAKTGQEGAWI